MIESKVDRLAIQDKGMSVWIAFRMPRSEAVNDFNKLKDKSLDGYTLTLKKKNRRSLDANAYMWVLCGKIADKIRATKEDVYRKAVRECGAWIDGVFSARDVPAVMASWGSNGIGWFCEQHYRAGVESVVSMRLYKGSSVYDSREMSRLIDYIVDEAQSLGIETMTPDEIERLKQLWGGKTK